MESTVPKNKRLRQLIVVLSIVIPVAVAVLFKVSINVGFSTTFLPSIYAGINGLTAVLLVVALVLVKQKKFTLHERVMKFCMVLSALFLVLYVFYHMTSESAVYGGTLGAVYYPILITHILLSVAIVPLVLYSFLFGIEGRFDKHRRLAKITWPIWFYVAVSGVVVYCMISPYYI